MSPRLGLALPVILALAAASARADTILDLSETASVTAQPDEIAASLRAEASAPAPAAAQAAVNRMMAQALARAHQTPALKITTGSYAVWLVEPAHPGSGVPAWRASQTLDLSGHDGPALLALTGALQQQGMAVQQLGWRLSAPGARTARDEALRQALSGLRARAADAAGLLGLRFASFRTVRLGPEMPEPPMPRASFAAAAMPSAEQGPIEVAATVTAEAVLAPKPP